MHLLYFLVKFNSSVSQLQTLFLNMSSILRTHASEILRFETFIVWYTQGCWTIKIWILHLKSKETYFDTWLRDYLLVNTNTCGRNATWTGNERTVRRSRNKM